jgi:hypothetical protein
VSGTEAATDLVGVATLERALLGAVLRDPAILARVETIVSAEDFSTALSARIFDAVRELLADRESVDAQSIAARLGPYEWDQPGGIVPYLESLAMSVPDTDPAGIAAELREHAGERRDTARLYDEDVVGWAHEQARLLTELSGGSQDAAGQIDWSNLVEEILAVGRSQVGGVGRKIELVFATLLRVASCPDVPSVRGWRDEVEILLDRIQADVTPAMRPLLTLDRLWSRARQDAAIDLDEEGEQLSKTLPRACPFTLDDLLDADRPDSLLKKLAGR